MPSDWQAQPAPYRDAPHSAAGTAASASICARRARDTTRFQGAPGEQHGYPNLIPASRRRTDNTRLRTTHRRRAASIRSNRVVLIRSNHAVPISRRVATIHSSHAGSIRSNSTRSRRSIRSNSVRPALCDAAYGDQRGYPPQNNSFQPAQGQRGYGSDPYYRGVPHDEDMYEDRPRARRRGGMLTVMAVLALAVVGTAGAFGYRAVFSNAGSVLTPPTIKADAGPNKVVPTSQASDASGKLIYDRVGDKGQPERVVSREEQPVDIKTAAPPPRVVLSSGMPNPIAPVPSTPVPPSAPAFAAPPARRQRCGQRIDRTEKGPHADDPSRSARRRSETASTRVRRRRARPSRRVEPVPATTTVRTTSDPSAGRPRRTIRMRRSH